MWCNVYSTREVLPVKRRRIFILVKGNINKCSNAANRKSIWQMLDSLSSKFLNECKSEHPYVHNIHLQQLDVISFFWQVFYPVLIQTCCRVNPQQKDCFKVSTWVFADRASAPFIVKIESPDGSSCGRWAPRCCHRKLRPRPTGGGSGWPRAAAGWGGAGRSALRGPTLDGTNLKTPQNETWF